MYWSLIFVAYYFALCKKIQDWALVKKSVQALFFFITLLIIMQLFGKDTLLNFNMKDPCVLGTIGNAMVLGTYVCVLAPFLIFTPLNWVAIILVALISGSSGTMLAVMCGLGVIVWKQYPFWRVLIPFCILIAILVGCATGDFSNRTIAAGRFPVWKRSVELSAKNPKGYGIGVNKILFPILSKDLESSKATVGDWTYENTKGTGLAWRRAHNLYIQLLFECGFLGLFLFGGWIVSIVRNVQNPVKIAGLVIIGVVSLTAFPDRCIQMVLLLMMFLAYAEQKEKTDGAR
jgi:O-antigen ligase